MEWLVLVGRVVVGLIVGFIVGTLVLWFCSYSVTTQNRSIKTAAIYNAITTVLWAILSIIGLVTLHSTESGAAATVVFVAFMLALLVSFFLLKGMYGISFWATVWLAFATWAVYAGIEKLMKAIF